MHTTLPLRHFLLALAVVAVWGTNFVVIKLALGQMPPLLFATLRFSLAVFPAILLLPRPPVPWGNLAAYGLLIGVGQFGLMFVAMNGHISPGLASLVVQTQVFFTIGMAMVLSKERLARLQWIALALATGGIAVIIAHTDGSTTPLGLVLMLLAALSWAGGNIVSRRAGPINMVAYVVWSACLRYRPWPCCAWRPREGCDCSRLCPCGLGHLGLRGLAGRGQCPVRLRRLGLAVGALPGRHRHPHGLAGAGVRHGKLGLIAGRRIARLEAGRGRPGAGRPGTQLALASYLPMEPTLNWA
jgi:hypothetical protein